jgi:SAM-dependent methyltransferase
MAKRAIQHDGRPAEQIREHYVVEMELASRLRTADRAARRSGLYTELYEELYRRVPHHMKLTEKVTPEEQQDRVERQLRWIRAFLDPRKTFLEVGAGDCHVTLAVAPLVAKSIAVEVSHTIAANADTPANFELMISDGVSIPVPPGSVDVVYSQQLMEHLHPDDALEQLRSIFAALRPGGVYLCATPNALTGPHDISRHFDDRPTGFHMKEYRIGELVRLLRGAGFSRTKLIVNTSANPRLIPPWPAELVEAVLGPIPRPLRLAVAPHVQPRVLYTFRLAATK